MAFGTKKKSKKKKKNKGKSSKVYVGSVWENEGKKGTFFNVSVDNRDPEDEYYRGDLIWRDEKSGNYYRIKGFSLYEANDNAPDNLAFKLVLDLENEDYHVEEIVEDD